MLVLISIILVGPVLYPRNQGPAGATINGQALSFKQVSSGNTHTCAIASDNQAYCWGLNDHGQLGNNSTTQSNVPVAVTNTGVLAGKSIVSISAGGSYTCAIASDNQAYCWGSNQYGQLGNNPATGSNVPVAVINTGVLRDTTTDLANSSLPLRLQFAPRGAAASCSAVSSGWAPVTSSSTISYDNVAPSGGLAIGSLGADDPMLPADSSSYAYQTTVRSALATDSFTNAIAITPGQTSLWDFVLRDRSANNNTSYCFRMVTDTVAQPGSSVDTYSQYPEIQTATGDLGVRFTDNSNNTLTNPTTGFSGAVATTSSQSTSATLSNSTSQQLEVANSATNSGWSVSLAATGGPSAKWQTADLAHSYPFNNANSTLGQLSVNSSAGSFAASGTTPSGSTCSNTGLSFGGQQSFISGSIDAITLASASGSSDFNCSFKLRNLNLNQVIPANQPAGNYTLQLTATVMAT